MTEPNALRLAPFYWLLAARSPYPPWRVYSVTPAAAQGRDSTERAAFAAQPPGPTHGPR